MVKIAIRFRKWWKYMDFKMQVQVYFSGMIGTYGQSGVT